MPRPQGAPEIRDVNDGDVEVGSYGISQEVTERMTPRHAGPPLYEEDEESALVPEVVQPLTPPYESREVIRESGSVAMHGKKESRRVRFSFKLPALSALKLGQSSKSGKSLKADRETGFFTQRSKQRAIGWCVFLLPALSIVLAIVLFGNVSALKSNTHREVASELKPIAASLEQVQTQTGFVQDAQRKLLRYAHECFTFNGDPVDQSRRLAKVAGGPSSCGWDGNGAASVIQNPAPSVGWLSDDGKAVMMGVEMQIVGLPGYFDYLMPFSQNDDGKADFAGVGSFFGVDTNQGPVTTKGNCESSNVGEDFSEEKVRSTIQSFMNAMTGKAGINIDYLLAPGSQFKPFGAAFRSSVVQDTAPCQSTNGVQYVTATVQFSLPTTGAKMTSAYAFGLINSNAGKQQVYQVKQFGPAPWVDMEGVS